MTISSYHTYIKIIWELAVDRVRGGSNDGRWRIFKCAIMRGKLDLPKQSRKKLRPDPRLRKIK